jgi:copper(I)-binding protein
VTKRRTFVLISVSVAITAAIPQAAHSEPHRGQPQSASVTRHGIEIRDAYAERSRTDALTGYFSVQNDAARPDTLLAVVISGRPAPLWHRHVSLRRSDLSAIQGCGDSPDAQSVEATRLHWSAITVPARGGVALSPGLGQLTIDPESVHDDAVAVEFDFDLAGPVTLRIPVRS